MKRLKLVLFPIILLFAIVLTGTIVKAALPSTVSVSVKSYFDGQTPIVNTASDKAYGTKVSFESSLGSVEGHTFVCWFVNGIVRLDLNVSTEFYATENMVLEAVFSPSDKHTVMFLDSNGKLLEVQYVANEGNATDITEGLPTKPGYIISSTNKWGKELTNITGDTFMVLQYEKSDASTFAIAVNNGTGSGIYAFNEVVTVVANGPEEDMYFSHWTDGTRIVSRQASYTFTVLQARTLTAVYSGSAPSVAPFVTLSTDLNIRDGYQSYLGQFYLPEGYELVEYGVVLSSESSFDFDSSYISKKQSNQYNSATNEWLVSLRDYSHRTVRAYLVYKNGATLADPIYSSVIDSKDSAPLDLFFSEYGEGSGSNKWIEIYNPMDSSVDLSSYDVRIYVNGASSATPVNLSGTLASHSTYVIYNSSTNQQVKDIGNLSNNTIANFNGDDALSLSKNGVIIDVFGVIGIDPGTNWANITLDRTLVREFGIEKPSSIWSPSEWRVYPSDTFGYAGFHQTEEILVQSIEISGNSSVTQGETISLTATVSPSGAVPSVTWSSDNTSVAIVNYKGIVTGVGAGTVNIKATSIEDDEIFDLYEILVNEIEEGEGELVEKIVYQTGFESSDSFTASSIYNNTTINYQGPELRQWGFYYGTPSTTGPITGSQSAQLRYYTSAPSNHGYVFMNFQFDAVTKIEFKALNTSGNNVKVEYSTDGGANYTGAQTFTLGTSASTYTYIVDTSGKDNVRIKFTLVPGTTTSSRVTIDDIVIYGMRPE